MFYFCFLFLLIIVKEGGIGMAFKRIELMRPRALDESRIIRHWEDLFDLSYQFAPAEKPKIHVDTNLLFWEHHFPALEKSYPNGYKKTGTLRYKPGHIRMPSGNQLPVFETEEFKKGMPPRGIVTIDLVVACELKDITEEEWLHGGFICQDEMFLGMKTYYPDITPESVLSHYHFKNYKPIKR
jgi:hypothetical protein